jgi:hypothetical protein
MQPCPPLSTLCAATAMESAGISVAVFDSICDGQTNEVAGLTCFRNLKPGRLFVLYPLSSVIDEFDLKLR